MVDVVKTIFGVPIPNILILVGLAFLAIAVVGRISGKIEPGKAGRIASGGIGSILLLSGLSMHMGLIPLRPAPEPIPGQLPVIPPSPARILQFRAEPQAITAGKSVRLCYGVADARKVRIEPDVGEVQPTEDGCVTVTPPKTVPYALTAIGRDDQPVRREITVEVKEAKVPLPPAKPPTILQFEAQPPIVAPGKRTQLCYGVADARRVRIEPGVGDVRSVEKECVSVAPAQRTTYTLTATGPDGQQVSWRVTVGVEAPAPALRLLQIVEFQADPSTVSPGGWTRLCYEVRSASQVRIEPGVGNVRQVEKGCVKVTPAQTTSYTLTASGAEGRQVRQKVLVNVATTPSSGNAIRNFRVVSVSTSKLQVTVEYTYSGEYGSSRVFMAANALDSGGNKIGKGASSPLAPGEGRATVTIWMARHAESSMIDAVKMCMDVERGEQFHCETFPYKTVRRP